MNVRVWVGCLACYNDGTLNGEWMDAADASDWQCTRSTDLFPHEETWCFDHEVPGVSGELDPMTAVRYAEAFAGVEDHEEDAFRAWLTNWVSREPDASMVDEFREAYCGEYDSLDAYAWEMLTELYPNHETPGGFMLSVDTVAWEQDHAFIDGYVFRTV